VVQVQRGNAAYDLVVNRFLYGSVQNNKGYQRIINYLEMIKIEPFFAFRFLSQFPISGDSS